jgi:hypothetical protein
MDDLLHTESAALAWATQEFGATPLGDPRRTARLVRLAAAAAQRPGGTLTHVCRTDAERQGGYGLLANPAVTATALGAAHYDATARRAAAHAAVLVPLDDSSLTITDRARAKGLGALGSGVRAVRGVKVLHALAVPLDGATLGLLAQTYWTRDAPATRDRHHRPLAAKESRHWADVAAAAAARRAAHAPGTHAWFQKDAGADSAELLLRDLAAERLMTVRAVHDRRVVHPAVAHVRAALAAAPVACTYDLAVPARKGRAARTATIAVRHAAVTLRLWQRYDRRLWAAPVWVVWAHEVGTTPAGERPIDWLLYTSYPVEDAGDAALVLRAYALRWRLEEFHFTWKSGACDATATELRTLPRIVKWATLLAAVASRELQLRDASRAPPDVAASTRFDVWELRAIVALRAPRVVPDVATLTLEQAVRWVADIGGYTGRSSGGPPGVVVIGRGLIEVVAAAKALRFAAANKL